MVIRTQSLLMGDNIVWTSVWSVYRYTPVRPYLLTYLLTWYTWLDYPSSPEEGISVLSWNGSGWGLTQHPQAGGSTHPPLCCWRSAFWCLCDCRTLPACNCGLWDSAVTIQRVCQPGSCTSHVHTYKLLSDQFDFYVIVKTVIWDLSDKFYYILPELSLINQYLFYARETIQYSHTPTLDVL